MNIALESQTGNPYYSSSASVVIQWTDIPAEAVEFLFVINDDTPPDTSDPGWTDIELYPLGIDVADGLTTLYAYVKDAVEIIDSASDWIVYSQNTPVITYEPLFSGSTANTITVSWSTDVDAAGWVEYRIKDTGGYLLGPPSENVFSTIHNATIANLVDQTTYEIRINANTSTEEIELTTQTPEPTSGNVAWSGGATPDGRWTLGANWLGLQPPANPTGATVTYADTGIGTTGKVNASAVAVSKYEPIEITAGIVLDVYVDGAALPVTIVFPETIPSATAAEVAAIIDAAAAGFSASAVDQAVEIRADSQESSTLEFSGDAAAALELPQGLVRGTWQVGSLDATNAAGIHTIDISGNALAIDTLLNAANAGQITIGGGRLRLGQSPESRANISFATHGRQLTLSDTLTLEPYVHTISSERGVLDMSGMKLADEMQGLFEIDTLHLVGDDARIIMDDATDIGTLAVRFFYLAAEYSTADRNSQRVRMGDADGKLPAGMSLRVGNKASETLGRFYIGRPGHNFGHRNADGKMILNGGEFHAYVDQFYVGVKDFMTYTYPRDSKGELDIRNAGEFELDAQTVWVGVATGGDTKDGMNIAYGTLYLPEGAASADALKVGSYIEEGLGSGYLQLDSTDFDVADSLYIGTSGQAVVNVAGESCGFTLATGASLHIDADGVLKVNFNQLPDTGDLHYALKWDGSHASTLIPLLDSGRIQFALAEALTLAGYTPGVFYDSDSDITYLAVMIDWPPAVYTYNLELEIIPPEHTTLVVDIDDIDATEPDPGILARWLTCPAGVVSGDGQTVTFENVEDQDVFEVTVWHEVEFDGGTTEVSGTATVTARERLTPTDGNVTWSGGASTHAMARPEWFWGANWEGGRPPQQFSTATVTFPTDEVYNPSSISMERGIGSLLSTSIENTHSINLGGNTLAIANELRDTAAGAMEISNGTLRLGTSAEDRANVILTGRYGHVTLSDTVVLEPYINTISLEGYSDVILCLEGVNLASEFEGILSLDALKVRGRDSSILMNDATGIDTLALRLLYMGAEVGADSYARIGDATGKLPTGMNLHVGDKATNTRGRIHIGYNLYHLHRVHQAWLYMNGGSFKGYLDELHVGVKRTDGFAGRNALGVLDLSTATPFELDVETAWIGTTTGASNTATGDLYLPEGQANAGVVQVSNPAADGTGNGTLRLDGTDFAVATYAEFQHRRRYTHQFPRRTRTGFTTALRAAMERRRSRNQASPRNARRQSRCRHPAGAARPGCGLGDSARRHLCIRRARNRRAALLEIRLQL